MKYNISLLLCHILFMLAVKFAICRADSPDELNYLPAENYRNDKNSYDQPDLEEPGFLNSVNRIYSAAYADRIRALDESNGIGKEGRETEDNRSDRVNPNPSSPELEYLRYTYSKPRGEPAARNGDSNEVGADGSAVGGTMFDTNNSNDIILNVTNIADAASKLFAGGNIATEIKVDSRFKELPEEVYTQVSGTFNIPPGKCICESLDGTKSFFNVQSQNGSHDINFNINSNVDEVNSNANSNLIFGHINKINSNFKINTDFDTTKFDTINKVESALMKFYAMKNFNTILNGQESNSKNVNSIMLQLMNNGKLAYNNFATLSNDELRELYKKLHINIIYNAQGQIDAQALFQAIAKLQTYIKAKALALAQANSKVKSGIQGQFIIQGDALAQAISQAQIVAQLQAQAKAVAQAQAEAKAQINAQLQAQAQAQAQIDAQIEAQLQAQAKAQAQATAQAQIEASSNTHIQANKVLHVNGGGGGGGGIFGGLKLGFNEGMGFGGFSKGFSSHGVLGLGGLMSASAGSSIGGYLARKRYPSDTSGSVEEENSSPAMHLSARQPAGYYSSVTPAYTDRLYDSTVYDNDGLRGLQTNVESRSQRDHSFSPYKGEAYPRYP